MAISLDELAKSAQSLKISQDLLDKALVNDPHHIELHRALRDSCIQRFEFCVELAWKTSMRALQLQTRAPAPAVRDMAQNQLISDPNLWFRFLEARNKSSHTYDEDVAQDVFAVLLLFTPELDELIAKLRKLPALP